MVRIRYGNKYSETTAKPFVTIQLIFIKCIKKWNQLIFSN